jgi:hypothetical protein
LEFRQQPGLNDPSALYKTVEMFSVDKAEPQDLISWQMLGPDFTLDYRANF